VCPKYGVRSCDLLILEDEAPDAVALRGTSACSEIDDHGRPAVKGVSVAAPKNYPDELRERAVRLYRESDPKPVIPGLSGSATWPRHVTSGFTPRVRTG